MAALETFLLVRLFPEHLYFTSESEAIAQWVEASIFAFTLNYWALFLFSRIIYPTFLSPLRKIPRPKVSEKLLSALLLPVY